MHQLPITLIHNSPGTAGRSASSRSRRERDIDIGREVSIYIFMETVGERSTVTVVGITPGVSAIEIDIPAIGNGHRYIGIEIEPSSIATLCTAEIFLIFRFIGIRTIKVEIRFIDEYLGDITFIAEVKIDLAVIISDPSGHICSRSSIGCDIGIALQKNIGNCTRIVPILVGKFDGELSSIPSDTAVPSVDAQRTAQLRDLFLISNRMDIDP